MRHVIFALGLIFLTTGCATRTYVLSKTEPNLVWDEKTKAMKKVYGPAGYYALLPFTVTADIVTAPVQLVAIGLFEAQYRSQTRGAREQKPATAPKAPPTSPTPRRR